MTGTGGVEYADGPEPAAEPGVEHILVLPEVCRGDGRIQLPGGLEGFFCRFLHHYAAVGQVPGGDALAPPELTGDAPVVRVLHPVAVDVAILVRNELDAARFHLVKCLCRKVLELEEPLLAELGLDYGVCALAVADGRYVLLYLNEVACLFKHLADLLAGHEPVFSNEDLRLGGEAAVVVKYLYDGEVVALAYLVVVRVVRGGDLEAAGTEIHLHVVVFNHRYFPVDEGDEHLLAAQVMVALVCGIYADGGVCHYGFRAGGGDGEELVCGMAVTV